MGGGWPTACLVFAVLAANVRGDVRNEDRWSRPATPERRQGDWVPLTCANCRPLDQGVQESNNLPSVLTPPPRVEDARLLPPPPPPDGLFQQAATGFLQAFTQQQPPRKPHQFFQETTGQSLNRPQAQFLKSNGPLDSKPSQQFLHEPSTDFQPPQLNIPQSNRQPQLLPFNQQQFNPESNPYLNQPLFLGPQFLAAPFFPRPSISAHNIQPINPAQIQQTPILPNAIPVNNQHFQVPADRPEFTQQITVGNQQPTNAPQHAITQTSAPQDQYFVNETENQKNEAEREEVQLLYVPVETLNQRARNLGRQKSLPSNQQDVSAQQVVGTESNRFTSPELSFDVSTRKPHLEDHENFNTQIHSSKHQYNTKQHFQYQQQLPPEDQEKYNTQTHSVRQQFNVKPQHEQFQQPQLESADSFKLQAHSTKQQYNVKQNDQFQQQTQYDRGNLNSQLNLQQNVRFQQQPPLESSEEFQAQEDGVTHQGGNLNDHYQAQQDQANYNSQTSNFNQQFNTHQNNNNFQQQFNANQNPQFHSLPESQQTFKTLKEQPYVNQPIQFDHPLSTEQSQIQQQIPTQQTQPQSQFDLTDFNQQTASPVPQTRVPDTYTTQQIKKQRFRNQQQDTRNLQKEQSYINEPLRFDQQLSTPGQVQQQVLAQQAQSQQQFDLPEVQQQTSPPVTHTRVPETSTTQQVNRQRFRNQQDTRNLQREQSYIDESQQFNQQLSTPAQAQQVLGQQAQSQQQFDLPDVQQQTAPPVTRTRAHETFNTQQVKKQRFRNQQQGTRNLESDQSYIDESQQFNQQLSTPAQAQQVLAQQAQSQQQFDLPDVQQQTAPPVTQTRAPETFNTQQVKKQRFRNQQQDTRNLQRDQSYIDESQQFNQQFGTPAQAQHVLGQQAQSQQTFDLPEVQQQTAPPVTQTRVPETTTTQQVNKQRFRNPSQDTSRNAQQFQNSQFTRQFPEDYQQSTVRSTIQNIDSTRQPQNVRQNQQELWSSLQNSNQQPQTVDQFQSDHHHVSSIAPISSTLPPQTSPAPNQPPLSVYMETTEDTKVNDVLRLLKNAKTIQVLDTVGPESPQVFVGPSNLKAPTGYIKFELPYLNAIESNRVERKVDKLPFFVAPLNFNPPPGYSKIPFPAPHIGSVVVSNVTVLNKALHEKPYEIEPLPVSTSERYLDQFTLPAQISPISPQLPSLINSLQDEIYSVSSTTTTPSTTTETTTLAYTTPVYRGRGSSRGSYRGSSSYPTSASPTRRPQSRTRRPYDGRPYSRRQPVTTTTTTEEPSTAATVEQHFTPQPEQSAFNSEAYVQNTAAPSQVKTGQGQPNLQSGNSNTYYDEQFVPNNFNQQQFVSQQHQFSRPVENQNIQHEAAISNTQNGEQYPQNSDVSQNSYEVEAVSQTTVVPTVAVPEVQQEEHAFKSQRTSSSRRDSSRPSRYRGRQRLTTTTTETYEEPNQPTENQFNRNVDSSVNYQTVPSRHQLRNHNQHRLVESTHFEANVPENKYSIQTERADVGFQTTERLSPQNEQQFIQQNVKQDYLNSQTNSNSQFQQPTLSQNSEPALHQFQQTQPQFSRSNTNFEQSNLNGSSQQNSFDYVAESQQTSQPQFAVNQFQQVGSQREFLQQPVSQQEPKSSFEQVNLDQERPFSQVLNQQQRDYFDSTQQKPQEGLPSAPEQIQTQNQQQYISDQQSFLLNQQNVRDPSSINQGLQGQHVSTSGPFEQVTEVTASLAHETHVQTQETETPKVEEEPQVQQYNQQRLVKYSRPHSRVPASVETSSNEEQTTSSRRGQHHHQSNIESSEASTTEPATTRASLVRVRGRVRNRQRASTRNYQKTTEAPNYPTTYLSNQRNNQGREETQEYTPKKRVNYNSRPSYSSIRNNNQKEVTPEQSITEDSYVSTEKQPTSERFPDYTEVATTTEATRTTPMKRYQHILNRNKVRRTRPTNAPSTSGSSGTARFLLPTTPPPVTRLPGTRGRIRKPGSTTTTSTTENPKLNPSWNERETFAPSAGSNEILEPLYQTRDKAQPQFGFQRNPVPSIPQKTTQKPIAAEDDDDYWNQAVTIQQSTSFDFKPDSPVTPPSFQASNGQFQGTFSPIWNGQIELQDGNYYDVFNQHQVAKNVNDQTPFSSDQQKVVYKEIKNRRPIGKENQYTEKTTEVKRPSPVDEEEEDLTSERVYPVYREIIKPAETIQDETSQVIADPYESEERTVHEKDNIEQSEQRVKNVSSEETVNSDIGSEIKEGALKRKIYATNSGKKGGRRRGSWVRVRVRKPQDMFETAESQNLASLSENAIQAVTKTVNEKVAWTPEPSTELPQTTETVSEPAETINFEEALKDMLKEFITSPEEENKEEAETETNTNNQSNNQTLNTTESTEEIKPRDAELQTESESSEKQNVEDETAHQDTLKPQYSSEEDTQQEKEELKTALPEVTTEVFTQEPTTILQTSESADTTLEPEVTTTLNEQVYNSHHSRVLGTSTTTEISLETEICYRGRCVKTKKTDSGSDLLTTE